MGSSSRRLLNQPTHSSVAYSMASKRPRPAPLDHLGLVKAFDRLGQSVVVAIADAANRWLDPGFGKALGIVDGYVLRPATDVVHQAAAMRWPAIMQRLLERIQHEAGMRRPAGPPADDPSSIGIDNEGT